MKPPLIFLLALALVATGCATDAVRQTHRDRYGNRTGTTRTRGGRQYHYDKYGNLTGTSTLPAKGEH